MKLRDVERTPGDAVAATDAVLLLKIDDSVFKLNDGAVSRTRAQAPWIFAVHALVLAQQPHEVTVVALFFDKLDQVVVIPLGGRHRLVRVVESSFAKRMLVPFNARDFASLAANASGHVDVFTNFFFATRAGARHRSRMRRDFLNLKPAGIAHLLSFFLECADLSAL